MGDVATIAPPSGDQFELSLGDQHVVVTEVGATLRSYTADGAAVLDGFARDEASSSGRGQILSPWPNRLEDGRYTFEDITGTAALDEPEAGNAIHGLVRWESWRLDTRSDHAVRLVMVLHPQPGYPWRLELGVRYELTPTGLAVTLEARNGSDVAAPFGVGFHPYLSPGTELVDEALLTIPAERWIATDDRGLPIGEHSVAEGEKDFRSERQIGPAQLDTAFTDLARDPDGRTVVILRNERSGRSLSVWMDEGFRYVQVYTGDTLDPVERRRHGVAIEPMTCPANAFRTGTDVIRLEPGGSWRGRWGISVKEGS